MLNPHYYYIGVDFESFMRDSMHHQLYDIIHVRIANIKCDIAMLFTHCR